MFGTVIPHNAVLDSPDGPQAEAAADEERQFLQNGVVQDLRDNRPDSCFLRGDSVLFFFCVVGFFSRADLVFSW